MVGIRVLSVFIVVLFQLANGYKPKAGRRRYDDKNLLDKLTSMDEGNDKWCMQLEVIYQKEHMLTRVERTDYCEWECTFLDLTCGSENEERVYFSVDSLAASADRLVAWVDARNDTDIMVANVNNDTLSDMQYVAWRVAPMLFSLPPLLMSRSFVGNYTYFGLYLVTFLCVAYLCGFGIMTTIYISYVTVASSIFPVTSYNFNDAAASIFILGFCLGAVLLTGAFMQFGAVITIILSFITLFKKSFYDKRSNTLLTVMYILQIGVCLEHLAHVRDKFSPNTLSYHVLWSLIATVFPQHGGNASYFLWSVQSASVIDDKVGDMGLELKGGLFLYMLIQWFAFLSFRALYGVYIMRSLRFKMDFHCIMEGLYIYTVDLFGGIQATSRLLTRQERMNHRRILYIIVGSAMSYFEYFNAFEVFFVRFFVSISDMLIIGSDYSKIPKYLGVQISFEHCNTPGRSILQNAFPQKGSVPWVSLDNITKCCQFIKRIGVNVGSATFCGEGFVTRNLKGDLYMLSVKHMFPRQCSMVFDDHYVAEIDAKPLNENSDPVVSVELGHYSQYGNAYLDAPMIPNIVKDEVPDTSLLVFLNTDEGRGPMINVIDKFRVDRNREGFSVSVDFKKGDSGGAVLAVMKNGDLRYAGAVSKGSSNMNSGNFISWAIQGSRDGHLSSDDESCNDRLVDSRRGKTFNVKRNRRPTVIGESQIRSETVSQLRFFLGKHKETLARVDRLPYIANTEDFKDENSFNVMKHDIANAIKLDSPREVRFDDDQQYEGESNKPKGRKRVKSSNKNRAAQKRRILVDDNTYTPNEWKRVYKLFYEAYEKLRTVYDEVEARNLFGLMLKGEIPDLKFSHFNYNDGLGYVYTDGDSYGEYNAWDTYQKPHYD